MNLMMEGWPATPVRDFAEASGVYCERRDASGLGASAFAEGRIVTPAGVHIGRISYNGRVWPPGKWRAGDEPLWDKRDPGAHPAAFPDPAGGLTMAQSDALSDMHHDASRARRALAALGIDLEREQVTRILAAAFGHPDATAYRTAVLKAQKVRWHHGAARVSLIAAGVPQQEARTAADAMARAVDRQIVTLTEISDMVAAVPGVAMISLETAQLDREMRDACLEARIDTIGDLATRGDEVPPGVLDTVLDLLTHQRKNGD